ncbi:MAG: glutaredoxin 3 [Pseudomonadota bacterium]
MMKVEIYTRPLCGYCSAAVKLLRSKEVEFSEIEAGFDPAKKREMLARSNGGSTFPQIFIDGAHIGGCSELMALEQAGELDKLLAAP